MNRIIKSSVLITLSIVLHANAKTASISKFVAQSVDDRSIVDMKSRMKDVASVRTGLPLVDDIEFRIRNQGFVLDAQRYTLRIKPQGFGETHAGKEYFSDQITRNSQKVAVKLNAVVKNRFDLVLELSEQQRLLQIYSDLVQLQEDRITVLRYHQSDMNFKLSTLIEAEHELSKLQCKRIDTDKSIRVLQRNVRVLGNDDSITGFDLNGFFPIDSIIGLVENTEYALDTNNVYLNFYRSEFNLAKSRYALERSENRKIISYIEFSYDNDEMIDQIARRDDGKQYDMKEAYMLGVGFSIPDFTASRYDIMRKKSALLSAADKYQELKRELELKLEKDIDDMRSYISQYRYLKARETEADAEASLKKYLIIDNVDPLDLLFVKESILKNAEKIEAVQFGLIRNYIKVLDLNGTLTQTVKNSSH